MRADFWQKRGVKPSLPASHARLKAIARQLIRVGSEKLCKEDDQHREWCLAATKLTSRDNARMCDIIATMATRKEWMR